MLKRALLAAQEEGLPHKAICDYLHTLSQMAKLESSAPPKPGAGADSTPASEGIQDRLRQAIADVYGMADMPNADSPVSTKE